MDMRMIATAAEMARALDEPGRLLEVSRHQKAILGALNASHYHGEQDAMCVFEAISHVVAQLVGGLPDAQRAGVIGYIAARTESLSHEFKAGGLTADFKLDA